MRIRTFAIIAIAGATFAAQPANAQDAVGALQNHQAHLGERTTVSDCDRYYRSFMARNSMPTSRRLHALRLCKQQAAQVEFDQNGFARIDPIWIEDSAPKPQ